MGLFDIFRKDKTDALGNSLDEDLSNTSNNDIRTNYDYNGSFRMVVEDVFTITGRGTVVTGRIETGVIQIGDEVIIQRVNGESFRTVVTGVEMFRKLLKTAQAGDNVGLLLRGISRNQVERGDTICK